MLLLLWDDRTSVQTIGFKTQGQLGTHDEDTKDFFADSKVVIKLALRCAHVHSAARPAVHAQGM